MANDYRNTNMKIYKQAKIYLDYFEIKDKPGSDNGHIVVFKPGKPDKLQESVYDAHGDKMPDNWTFDIYHSILSNIVDYEPETIEALEEIRHEIVDGLVDVYTSSLTSWLASHNSNAYYLDEAVKEYGSPGEGSNMLMLAQFMAIDEIFTEVYKLLNE